MTTLVHLYTARRQWYRQGARYGQRRAGQGAQKEPYHIPANPATRPSTPITPLRQMQVILIC